MELRLLALKTCTFEKFPMQEKGEMKQECEPHRGYGRQF